MPYATIYELLNILIGYNRELQGLAGIVRDILPWQHQSGIGRETSFWVRMKPGGGSSHNILMKR